ncbi:tetratricopeptide repeat protein [Methylogaea oryzae]|uniref:tetratricopeptide repeat protein n=1 Tax=Methylogaea oryzae TaxID=1295382 RepID=UPI00138F4A81|nr:tetratricopeptide repeat protein [Methylogaea oryzae]
MGYLKILFFGGSALLLAACAPTTQIAQPDLRPYDKVLAPFLQVLESRQPEEAGSLTLDEWIKRGDELRAKGDKDEAMLAYLQSYKLSPNNIPVLLRLGRLHRDRHELELAELALRSILDLEQSSAEARADLGLVKLDQRDRVAAEQLLEEALRLDSARWEAHDALGVLADLRGDHGGAVAHYEAALKVHVSPMVLNNLGYSYYLAGDLEQARARFQQALSADPSFQRAQYNLALVTAKLGSYQEAVALFGKLMEPDAAYNNVGYLCMMEGKYDEAEAFFRKAIEISPKYNVIANENLKALQRMRSN